MNKTKLYWTLQIGGWLTFAIAQMVMAILTMNQEMLAAEQVVFLLLEAGIFFLVTHVFRNIISKNDWMSYRLVKLIPRIMLSIFVMSFFVYFARLLVSIPLDLYRPVVALSPVNIIGLSFVYMFILFLWVTLYFIYHYFERYNTSLKYAAAMHEIELNNLKAQLNPHFIFNALNSIRALINENPSKSKNAVTQLSNILRNSLISEKKKLTTFDNELRMVRDYLGLEIIRFEERLKVDFEIGKGSSEFLIPPLMLQTLVENSVKHGISRYKNGGFVKMKSEVIGKNLSITIRNTGKLLLNGKRREAREGLGLKNTRQRLSMLYGDNAKFDIFNEESEVVCAQLIIPNLQEYESTDNR